MTAISNPYEVLGVSDTATPDEIKQAFRVLARQYHPDANPGDSKAEACFKEVSAAHDVLGDPIRKKGYDDEVKAEREDQKRKEKERQQRRKTAEAMDIGGMFNTSEPQPPPPPPPPPPPKVAPPVPKPSPPPVYQPATPQVPSSQSISPSRVSVDLADVVAGSLFAFLWYCFWAECFNGFEAWWNPVAIVPVVGWLIYVVSMLKGNG